MCPELLPASRHHPGGRRRAIRCLTWCVGRLARTYCRPFSRCSASPAGLTTPSLACAMARIRGSVHLTWPCRRRRWMLSKQQANALERSCSTGRACRIKRGWRRGWHAEAFSGAERRVGQSSLGMSDRQKVVFGKHKLPLESSGEEGVRVVERAHHVTMEAAVHRKRSSSAWPAELRRAQSRAPPRSARPAAPTGLVAPNFLTNLQG